MIGKLSGRVDAVGADEAVVDVGGVGYLVQCGSRTLQRIPPPGEAVSLHIETYVREDAFKLFGFMNEEERAWFVRLQAIQGVGAKVALAILDVLEPGEVMAAVANEDKAAVARANGVGPRLAQRIVTELKGKPAPPTRYGGFAGAPIQPATTAASGAGAAASGPDARQGVRADAVSALANLGIAEPDAAAAVTAALSAFDDTPALDSLVKAALKEVGR